MNQSLRYVAITCLFLLIGTPAQAEVVKTTVFRSGEDGYHTYRIPTIVRAKNGDLLAFCEGRKKAHLDDGDIDIMLKRSTDDGKTWGAMQLVQDEEAAPTAKIWIGNPVPVVDHADKEHPGRVWLVFTRANAQLFVTSSDDNGLTWSKRRSITPAAGDPTWNLYASGPVHGIQLDRGPHAGRLLIPCNHRILASNRWGVHFVYSDDHGATWKRGASHTHAGDAPVLPTECVAVELVDGRTYLNARNQKGSDPATRAMTYSSDGGTTFDGPFVPEPAITSPIVENSVIRFAATDQGDARNILIYSSPGDATQRLNLTILVSYDEGKTWTRKTVLHRGPSIYSDLIKLNKDKIGALFEAGKELGAKQYREILFATFGLDDLAAEE